MSNFLKKAASAIVKPVLKVSGIETAANHGLFGSAGKNAVQTIEKNPITTLGVLGAAGGLVAAFSGTAGVSTAGAATAYPVSSSVPEVSAVAEGGGAFVPVAASAAPVAATTASSSSGFWAGLGGLASGLGRIAGLSATPQSAPQSATPSASGNNVGPSGQRPVSNLLPFSLATPQQGESVMAGFSPLMIFLLVGAFIGFLLLKGK